MKKICLMLLFALFCLLPVPVQAREVSDIFGERFEEISGKGLEIRTNPSGVNVFIDNVEKDPTPVAFDDLGAGDYLIRLSKEGYKTREFKVTVFNTSRLVISIEMEEEKGYVLLSVYRAEGSNESLPFNPRIFTSTLDDTTVISALSPDNKTLLNLPTGYRTISVRAFGWEDEAVSVFVYAEETINADIYMKPASFKMKNFTQSRKSFNPNNPGSLGYTEYRFEVSAPGTGRITIKDSNGFTVYEKRIGAFDSHLQYIIWNGRDSGNNPLNEGTYTVFIEASSLYKLNNDETDYFSFTLKTRIDFSADIFPLSMESGISGLIFAPMPHVLAAGSFQIQADILFGVFNLPPDTRKEDSHFSGVPFKIGMRAAPLNKLECAAVINMNPRIKVKTGWGLSGSVKYNFFDGSNFPIAFGASLSYAWASVNGANPLSPGRGIGIHTPLSLELKDFSIVLTPAVFWRGPEGQIPALLLSAGVLYRRDWLTAGISMRTEHDFKEDIKDPRLLVGAQVYIFPPPSNFLFTVELGMWIQDTNIGGCGGIGIGIIY